MPPILLHLGLLEMWFDDETLKYSIKNSIPLPQSMIKVLSITLDKNKAQDSLEYLKLG